MLYSAPRCLTVCLAPAAAAAAVATIAMVMINLLPRRELAEIGENWEEGSEVGEGWVGGFVLLGSQPSGELLFVRRSHACVADVRPELDVAPPPPPPPPPTPRSSGRGCGSLFPSSLRRAQWRAAWQSWCRRRRSSSRRVARTCRMLAWCVGVVCAAAEAAGAGAAVLLLPSPLALPPPPPSPPLQPLLLLPLPPLPLPLRHRCR